MERSTDEPGVGVSSGAVAGGVVGGILCLLVAVLVVVAIFWLLKKHNRAKNVDYSLFGYVPIIATVFNFIKPTKV